MFPIALDLSTLPILLIGAGEAFEKRRLQLLDAGAKHLLSEAEFAQARVVMVAGLPFAEAKVIADKARAAGKLVNVEDVNELCDFYFMSLVQRGELTIAVSTNGASPTACVQKERTCAKSCNHPMLCSPKKAGLIARLARKTRRHEHRFALTSIDVLRCTGRYGVATHDDSRRISGQDCAYLFIWRRCSSVAVDGSRN
jgi:hypothetical protein